MKKIFTIFFFVFFIYPIIKCNAQYWVQQNNPCPSNIDLTSIYFINENTGVVSGTNNILGISIILRTTNGGNNWYILLQNSDRSMGKIHFPSANTGYVNASQGFYKTTNAGENFIFTQINNMGTSACFFTSNDTGFMYGNSAFIKKTFNGGATWTDINIGFSPYYLNDIYFLSANTGFISHYGIYMTTNAGLNWELKYTAFDINKIHFPSSNTGYCSGQDHECIKTTNGGLSWFQIQNWGINTAFYAVYFTSNNTGYIGGRDIPSTLVGKIYKTVNGGYNWQLQKDIPGKTVQCIFFPSSNVGYAVGNGGLILKTSLKANISDIYLYNDGRIQTKNITFTDDSCYCPSGTIDSLKWYVNNILIGTQHSMTYPFKQGTTYVQLKIKDSNGYTDSTSAKVIRTIYKRFTTGTIKGGFSSIGDNTFYAASDNDKVYRLDKDGNPLSPSFLLTLGNLSSCAISYDSCVFITSTSAFLFGFNKNGVQLWPYVSLGAQATCTPTIDSAGRMLYLGVENGNFLAINKDTAGTALWQYACDAPVKSSAVISKDRKLVCVSAKGTLYGFNLNLPNPSPPTWTITLAGSDSVLVSPAIDLQNNFYIGSKSGKLYKVSLSGAGSIEWTCSLTSPITTSIVIDGNGNIYAGTLDGKMHCIKSNGSEKTSPWPFTTPAAIKSTPAITGNAIIYFGNDAGELYGIDTNANKTFYYIDSSKISCVMLHKDNTLYFGNEAGRLFAIYDTTGGTYDYSGIYSAMWSTFQNNNRRTGNLGDGLIGIKKISDIVPMQFALYQNFPNPFNPATTIKFNIMKHSEVKIIIYDILGRETAILVNKKMEAGKYEVQWNTNNFASGVYFYKMEVKQEGSSNIDFVQTRKMVLLK
jgi:photosystem II stability/assembly factor-like uncharacterized protein